MLPASQVLVMSSLSLNSMPPPLLKLPLELRRQIYGDLLPISWNGVIMTQLSYSHQGLMTTNRQIHRELSMILYWDSVIPIIVYCPGVYLLRFWTTNGERRHRPLSEFISAR